MLIAKKGEGTFSEVLKVVINKKGLIPKKWKLCGY